MLGDYLKRGWNIIPLKEKKKYPYHDDWPTRKFKEEDFKENDNVGLRLENGVVDVDLDWLEAVAIAGAFLPETGAIFGRESKPKSHYLYACSNLVEPIVFTGPEGGKPILELRVGYQQETMLPPSIHPDGEEVKWAGEFTVATLLGEVTAETLKRRASLACACALIVKYFNPEGDRHVWCLAVAGALKQLGVLSTEAENIIRTAAVAVGDKRFEDRVTETRTTYTKSDDDPTAGWKRLREISKHLAEGLRSVLGDTLAIRGFIAGKNGGIALNKPENMRRALQKMKIDLEYDLFASDKHLVEGENSRRIEDKQLSDMHIAIDDRFGFLPPWELFCRVIDSEARQHPFHPVRDYLDSLTWDKVPRLDAWLSTYAGAEDTEYTRSVGSLALRAAVARVYDPGKKWDELLVLESPQGWGKSSALRALCPDPRWFSDDLPIGVDSKIVIERTKGIWIVEIADLFGMSKREVDQVKGFLSRQKDGPVRLAYGRDSTYVERQFICIGTTNRTVYLRDATGNRRFWPVRIKRFDVAGIERDRDLLWAEARARKHEPIRLDVDMWAEARQQQLSREVEDPWQPEIEEILKKPPAHFFKRDTKGKMIKNAIRVTSAQIYETMGITPDRRDDRTQSRLTDILHKLGFKKCSVSKNGAVIKGWGRDEDEGR